MKPNMALQERQWYAIYVRSRTEKKIGEALCKLGIENYVPLKREWRQWSDRKKLVETPAISGYVFVRINIAERLIVLKCQNVIQFVRHLQRDAVIRDVEIENLKLFLEQTSVQIEIVSDRIRPGTTVEVIEGPFIGYIGEMVEHHGKEKVIVRFDALQSSFLVEIEQYKITIPKAG
ncbi:UpxY family transcription antiterminator [Halosquirtibacter xylanolyticus]|uniref:UpxY family transcription antiterminator n=1 Tax=Halosquirtibacter xylanolyticus TaxID=3374599 RepID=UPI0037498A8C|nr:UpxY family transcription antiterminator [Prolixibacteraceae bacterium]